MSVNSKMTALADEIRELSGTEDTMGLDAMKTHIGEANTEVGKQTDLIEQIATALEGKSAAGGVSSNLNVANITVNGSYGTTFRYVGADGLATEQGILGPSTIQVVIPSICFVRSSSYDGVSEGFVHYNVSGGCSTIFNNSYCACVEITSSNANIIAISHTNGSSSQ